jgi:hypothetical protein
MDAVICVEPFRGGPGFHGDDIDAIAIIDVTLLIPQVMPAHKYPNSPWETIHPPGGDNAECVYPYKVYTAECNKSLTATYQCKTPIPSNKLLVNNILTNN